MLVAAGVLLLLAQALKAYGWGRLFVPDERPGALSLAAGNGGAALVGLVLPGRFDDAMRIAVVRRYPGCPAGVRVLCLSLVMLGLIDAVALAPLAFVAALFPGAGLGVRAALGLVALAGVAAAAVIVALPRLVASRRALRYRLGRWLSPRMTSRRPALQAWALVFACWLVRALAVFVLLGTLGVGFSFPLALLFLCAGAAAAALPVGLAGAATQVGVGGAALIASGVGASQALSVAVSVAALGVLSGGSILLFAVVWRTGVSLTRRATRSGSKGPRRRRSRASSTRPATRPDFSVASGIIESTSITSSAPAAKPLISGLEVPAGVVGEQRSRAAWRARTDRRRRARAAGSGAGGVPGRAHVRRRADRLGQVRDEDRDEQADADALAAGEPDARARSARGSRRETRRARAPCRRATVRRPAPSARPGGRARSR